MSGNQTGPKPVANPTQSARARRQALAKRLTLFNSPFATLVKAVNEKLMELNMPISEMQANYYVDTAAKVNSSKLFNSTAHAIMATKWMTNKEEPVASRMLGAFGNFGAFLTTSFDTTAEGKKFSNVGSGDDSMDIRLLMQRGRRDPTRGLFGVKKSPLFPK